MKSKYESPDILEVACEDLVKEYQEGDILYRARTHKNRSLREKFTLEELGAPSPRNAKASRANRYGEPVLYLASDVETALSEVRAWKGAAVAIAGMRISRRLFLVNLMDFEVPKSPFFEEDLRWKVQLVGLFHRFADDLSRPVIPDEEQHLYLPSALLHLK